MSRAPGGAFRSLSNPNYRLWAAGALVSNVGTWMQRIAQDWLVLTQLTRNDAAAVGIVSALQFAPQVLLLPLTGLAADRLDRRRLLAVTQGLLGALALGLGLLTVSGGVRIWHVDLFALLLGCVTAFDAPARQAFVSDLVRQADLTSAVALNSTSFNASRMIGPAVAGAVIAAAGCGWAFLVNAGSFAAVLAALAFIRTGEPAHRSRAPQGRGGVLAGLQYVWRRPDLRSALGMLFLVGTFGLNFAVFTSAMAVKVFHVGARGYGLLTSAMALGSVVGALLAARRPSPGVPLLVGAAALFGVSCACAALMPSYALFALALGVVGLAAQTFTTSTNSLVQLSTAPEMRGRVLALLLTIALGGQPLGAPLVGWVANAFGPRWAVAVAAGGGILAALVGARHLARAAESMGRAATGRSAEQRPSG